MYSFEGFDPRSGASGDPPELALEARRVCKTLAGRLIVQDASLAVRAGEGLALLGPNGAGKTTLLLLCAGALVPDAGAVRVAGRSVCAPDAREALGFVPQELALYEELSGAENLALFGRLMGLSGARLAAAVERALGAAGLWQVRADAAASYSGGMRRRLSVACALVHSPRLLLLDEPFAGVDDDSRAQLCGVLARQKGEGMALVISTHRLEEVSALCERVLELRAGRITSERALSAGDGSAHAIGPQHERSEHGIPITPGGRR